MASKIASRIQVLMACRSDAMAVEALLRWTHPDLGAVSPAEFIAVAEDSSQILQIGTWALRNAVTQLRVWLDSGLPAMTMAVNLSSMQFRHPNLPELIRQILADANIPPHYLELELTESVAMGDPLGVIEVMNKLHHLGVRMSIDDFGTGYSSLNYLKRFHAPADSSSPPRSLPARPHRFRR